MESSLPCNKWFDNPAGVEEANDSTASITAQPVTKEINSF